MIVCKPQANERYFADILNLLSQHSQRYYTYSDNNYLRDLLFSLQQPVRSGKLKVSLFIHLSYCINHN